MQPGIHIEMNILSSLVCVLLYYQQRRHKVFDFLGTTAFNSLLWSAVGVMVVDIASWFLMGDLIPHTDMALMIVQSIYYVCQAILPMFFMVYCVNASGRKVSGVWHVLMYMPVVITVVVVGLNLHNGFAFYILNNQVERGEGYMLAIVAPMIYISISLALCLVFYFRSRSASVEKRKIAFHMLMCVVISFLGATACVFVSYISPWHVFVSALIYLYMQLHSYREHSLDALATTDSLTGLKNHAAYSHIKEKMDEKIRKDRNHRFAVAVMDVNDLKRVNDVYGHKAGDALIISAGQLMCDVFQHSPVCRIGGDEFVAILENSDYESREELCRRFSEQMEKTAFSTGNERLPVSVALGLARYQPEWQTVFEEVFHAADEAMYDNKEQIKKARSAK